MRNITSDFIEISGSEISNDLFVYQNAEVLKNSTKQDLQDRTNHTKVLADVFATRIDEITDLLETTSRYPAVRNISYANLVGTEFMGIPEFSDIEKRNVAKYLLKMNLILAEYISRYPMEMYIWGNLIQHRNNSLDLTLLIEIGIKELVKQMKLILVRCSSRPLLELLQQL